MKISASESTKTPFLSDSSSLHDVSSVFFGDKKDMKQLFLGKRGKQQGSSHPLLICIVVNKVCGLLVQVHSFLPFHLLFMAPFREPLIRNLKHRLLDYSKADFLRVR